MRILLVIGAALTLAADWPQYAGPTRNGVSTEAGLARTWPKEGPKVVWEKPAGSGWSAPVVAGNSTVLFHRLDDQEVVECVDATGKEKWKKSYRARYLDEFNFDNGPRSTPLIAEDKVFTLGADGDLTCFSLADGKLIWQRNINKDYQAPKGFFGVATSPMLADGKLLINVGAKGAGVVAFRPENGAEVWKATDQGVSYSSPIVARIDGEELAVFYTRQGLLALTPGKGDVRYEYAWRPRINSSVNAASPIVSGNQIFLSTSYNTGAILLEANKGELKELWKGDESLSCHYNTPVLVHEHLYGIDGRQEGSPRLRCVELKTGKVLWTKHGFGCATLVAADGVILALTESGDLVMFQPTPDSYKELARASILGKPIRAAMALADGKVYARDPGKWICLDLKK